MFQYKNLSGSVATSNPTRPTELHAFVQEFQGALAAAASLLAGRRGAELVINLVDDLANDARVCRRSVKRACELLDILSLRHVDDVMRPEAGFFARLDPADPCAEDICVLTEGLADAIAQLFSSNITRSRDA